MKSTKSLILHRNVTRLRNTNIRYYSEIFPSSEVVIIKNKTKKKDANLKTEKVAESNNISNNSEEYRVNEVNIQMISRNIYEQLFKSQAQNLDKDLIKR